jgi:hypothetical protein
VEKVRSDEGSDSSRLRAFGTDSSETSGLLEFEQTTSVVGFAVALAVVAYTGLLEAVEAVLSTARAVRETLDMHRSRIAWTCFFVPGGALAMVASAALHEAAQTPLLLCSSRVEKSETRDFLGARPTLDIKIRFVPLFSLKINSDEPLVALDADAGSRSSADAKQFSFSVESAFSDELCCWWRNAMAGMLKGCTLSFRVERGLEAVGADGGRKLPSRILRDRNADADAREPSDPTSMLLAE